jgi:ADP-heptose:LPS heptosyltransferase
LLASGRPFSPKQWRRGLILGHNHIGDVLYRTCSLAALAEHLPNCRWDYLAAPLSAQVLKNNPAIDTVLDYQRGDDSWNVSPRDFRDLRGRRYDAVLCTNVVRYYPDVILATTLGVPNRVGFTLKGLSGLVTLPVAARFPRPYPAYFREMVGAITGVPPDWQLVPRIFPDDADRRAAADAWSSLSLASAPVVAASITTRQPGAWPREHYLRALEIVQRETAATIVLFGAPDEISTLREAAREMACPATILESGLNLRSLGVFLGRCSTAFTPDSGPRHLANAVGVPVVYCRSLIVRRVETGNYCENEIDAAPADEMVPPEMVPGVVSRLDPARTASMVIQAMRRLPA